MHWNTRPAASPPVRAPPLCVNADLIAAIFVEIHDSGDLRFSISGISDLILRRKCAPRESSHVPKQAEEVRVLILALPLLKHILP